MKKPRKETSLEFTLAPKTEFNLEEDGFVGALYKPLKDEYSGKVIIMFGGSDGNFNLTKLLAEQYVKRGMTILAIAYWNYPGLPDRFENNPIEIIEKPALWLKKNGFEKIGLWGISKGAELALIAGSLMPDLISHVTAVCPISICCQGFKKEKGIKLFNSSSWSWRGKELPYSQLSFSIWKVFKDIVREKGICLRSCYTDAVLNNNDETRIPVEKIDGSILILTPEYDGMWPSEIAASQIIDRLKNNNFKFPYQWKSYKYASHFLIPLNLSVTKAFKVEREYPDKCRDTGLLSLEETLKFWKENW